MDTIIYLSLTLTCSASSSFSTVQSLSRQGSISRQGSSSRQGSIYEAPSNNAVRLLVWKKELKNHKKRNM